MEAIEDAADCLIAGFAGVGLLRWRVSRDWARRWGRPVVWAVVLRDLVVARAQALPLLLRFAEGLQDLSLGLAQSGLTDDGIRKLAERIGDLPLARLKLDLRACPFRAGFASLAAALPRQLLRLHLTLKGWGFKDGSAEAVANHLPPSLQDLRLDFGGSHVTGAGAAAVFRQLPPALARLELLFFGCALGDRWLPDLAPRQPSRLLLDFSGTGLGDASVAGLGKLFSEKLQDLTLLLVGCGISDRGVRSLALPQVQELRLDLSGTELTDGGLAGLRLPGSLTTLHLGVAGCDVSVPTSQLEVLPPLTELHYDWGGTKLDADSASAIVRSLPASLRRLRLVLRDVALGPHAAGLAEHLPLGLQELRLDCTGCQLGPDGASAVHGRVAQMEELVQEEVLYDAFGTDVIVSVDEEELMAQGLLGVRANHVHPALHDAVYLNNRSILDGAGGPASKRRRRSIEDDEDLWCDEYL